METPPPKRPAPTLDALASVSDDGSRVVIHPADVRGRFMRLRQLSALALIAIYVLLPWIPVGGQPAVFLDVASLRFHFFGLTLAPQDFWLGFFLITGFGFSLFFVTALLGRVWCGWACPQTVFLEHVYRRVERWLEGDATERRRLDRAPWTVAKLFRRGAKHVAFVLISLVIAHVLLAYFVSLPRLWEMVTHAPTRHWGIFLFIVVVTGGLYLNFAWFREQLCIILCPYGRLQSALIDDNSVVIGYDAKRGEPRGPIKSSGAKGGDCIDCLRCVQVCPTGIDIRQGLQMECVACSACVDACDEVMDRTGRPRGLVRYDSLNGLGGLSTRILRPRIVLYSMLLLAGTVAALFSVTRFQGATFETVRMQGAPYYIDDDGVRNQFLIRVINKQTVEVEFTLRVQILASDLPPVSVAGWDEPLRVAAGAEEVRPLVISVPRNSYAGKFPFAIIVTSDPGAVVMERRTDFVGPDPKLLREHGAAHR